MTSFGIAVKFHPNPVIDGKIAPVITPNNAVDPDSLMAELVNGSMAYYTKLGQEGKATPNEHAAWMTRAAESGV